MNEIEALNLTLELWTWLKDNPECKKNDYPFFLSSGIIEMSDHCPLCEYYEMCINGCPLASSSDMKNCENFYNWQDSNDRNIRVFNCEMIIEKVKAKINQLENN